MHVGSLVRPFPTRAPRPAKIKKRGDAIAFFHNKTSECPNSRYSLLTSLYHIIIKAVTEMNH